MNNLVILTIFPYLDIVDILNLSKLDKKTNRALLKFIRHKHNTTVKILTDSIFIHTDYKYLSKAVINLTVKNNLITNYDILRKHKYLEIPDVIFSKIATPREYLLTKRIHNIPGFNVLIICSYKHERRHSKIICTYKETPDIINILRIDQFNIRHPNINIKPEYDDNHAIPRQDDYGDSIIIGTDFDDPTIQPMVKKNHIYVGYTYDPRGSYTCD